MSPAGRAWRSSAEADAVAPPDALAPDLAFGRGLAMALLVSLGFWAILAMGIVAVTAAV